jgi:hypothetical protein
MPSGIVLMSDKTTVRYFTALIAKERPRSVCCQFCGRDTRAKDQTCTGCRSRALPHGINTEIHKSEAPVVKYFTDLAEHESQVFRTYHGDTPRDDLC